MGIIKNKEEGANQSETVSEPTTQVSVTPNGSPRKVTAGKLVAYTGVASIALSAIGIWGYNKLFVEKRMNTLKTQLETDYSMKMTKKVEEINKQINVVNDTQNENYKKTEQSVKEVGCKLVKINGKIAKAIRDYDKKHRSAYKHNETEVEIMLIEVPKKKKGFWKRIWTKVKNGFVDEKSDKHKKPKTAKPAITSGEIRKLEKQAIKSAKHKKTTKPTAAKSIKSAKHVQTQPQTKELNATAIVPTAQIATTAQKVDISSNIKKNN